MPAKILEFTPKVLPYLAFVSLREQKILTDFVTQKYKIPFTLDEAGDTPAIHFHLTNSMVSELRKHFPNIHIVMGVL